MTVVELVVAVSLMAVVAAVMAPLLHAVQSSWAAEQQDSECLANARAYIQHFQQHVSQASHVTTVSDRLTVEGHLQFVTWDGVEARYEIDADDNIQFGPLGAPTDLAGPADMLRFTCYDASDFGTPITDGSLIRLVKVEVTLHSPTDPGRSHTLSTSVYIRAGVE
jgi:type II secretory pathway pseudopilin PulG